MGISANTAKIIRQSSIANIYGNRARKPRVLSLGRQTLAPPLKSLEDVFGFSIEESSLDFNSAEGANIICDLNQPVPSDMRKKFDIVIDGGTLEHIFDIRTAFENIFSLVAVSGFIIHINPLNNWINHGFYQISPGLIIATHKVNGFSPEEICFGLTDKIRFYDEPVARFYGADLDLLAATPRIIMPPGTSPSDMITQIVISKKTREIQNFQIPTQPFYDKKNYSPVGIIQI
jgi:hypothetical protein